MNKFLIHLIEWSGYKSLRYRFLLNPDRLLASKATIIIGFLVVLLLYFDLPFYAVSLGLGALAGALSETDDHPNGRLKSMVLKVFSFGISSLSVELLQPYPVIMAFGLALSTILFILLGGISERFRGVTFGALLIGVYTMIGAEISPFWYVQPMLLTTGALIYGVFSYILLWMSPYSLLEEELAKGYTALSLYLNEKSKLFPCDENKEKEIRNKLALLNVQTVEALDNCKEVLNSYNESIKNQQVLRPFFNYFMVLQSLHERATSSHDRYDILSSNIISKDLIVGIRLVLIELSKATKSFADCLLTGVNYNHPQTLNWLVNTMINLQNKDELSYFNPLSLLINNLEKCNQSLKEIDNKGELFLLPKLEKDSRPYYKRLFNQLRFDHPRMRYAIRLSIAFLIGYSISEYFDIAKGEWIVLTVLFVLQGSYSETRRRLLQRIFGTCLGVIIGVLIIRLFTFYGQILLLIVSAYLFLIWMKRRYSVSVIFITIFVLSAFNIISNKGVDVMTPRLLDTSIGGFISFLVVRFLWPEWQYKKLPFLLSDVIDKNTSYFKAILNEYKHPSVNDLAYRIARREAHRADNALVMAWKNIQLDPKKYQDLKSTAFKLTYLNHALLSYLSALGAHREQENKNVSNLLLFENHILKVLDKTSNGISIENNNNVENIEGSLEEISKHLLKNSNEYSNKQNIFLYNIAEVTLKIVEQAKLFKKSTKND